MNLQIKKAIAALEIKGVGVIAFTEKTAHMYFRCNEILRLQKKVMFKDELNKIENIQFIIDEFSSGLEIFINYEEKYVDNITR